nr:integrase, catalytic region, zinc finger, CCHC-type, peptidase aspartic, catalytic [Tanacetum cinerariifolium]
MEDRVMLNNSKGKKQEVEDQSRNVKLSKNKTFVTACNDSLNAKTLNVNFVCATCGKGVLNVKHDMCSKHMTRNLKLLINFVEKFLGTVKFRNDQITPILGYGDLVQGAVTIKQIRDLKGNDLLTVIVDDYSRYTWTYFLRSKDETPEVLIDFLRLVQRGLHAQEKGNACIFMGYSTQSRAYRVVNKKTRVIVETIHVNFDELPQMAS